MLFAKNILSKNLSIFLEFIYKNYHIIIIILLLLLLLSYHIITIIRCNILDAIFYSGKRKKQMFYREIDVFILSIFISALNNLIIILCTNYYGQRSRALFIMRILRALLSITFQLS